MRSLLILLLVANAGFFVWAQGWLAPAVPGPRHREREPQRLLAQVRPETVSVLAPQAASAALLVARESANAAASACLEAGPFSPADVAGAEAELASRVALGRWVRDPASSPATAVWLRVATAEPELKRVLLALPGPLLVDRFKPCGARPP